MELGKRIKALRKSKRMNLRELGERLGMGHSYISRVENGHHQPGIDLLEKLSEIFDVHISYFFNAEVQETPKELQNDIEWIAFGKEMEQENLTPEQIKSILAFAKKMKENL